MTEHLVSYENKLASLSVSKAKLLERMLQSQKGPRRIALGTRTNMAGKALAPVSSAQQRLWFIDQLEDSGAAYNIPIALELRGMLDRELLQKALDAVVSRHEVLRTVFVTVDGEPMQQIAASGSFALSNVDLSACGPARREERLRVEKHDEAHAPFDLTHGPLIRGRLICLHSDEHVLLITMHHIVSDGWSVNVMLSELTKLYVAFLEGRADPLTALRIQYADYGQWQRQWMQQELDAQLSYWRARLGGAASQLQLPVDRMRPAIQSYRGSTIELTLNANLSRELKALARRHGLTLFMVLYAGWAIMLSRLSGQTDIVIGTPVANRRQAELEGLIGLLLNMLALRVEVEADMTLEQFLQRVKEVTLSAYDHQDTPFEKVVEALRPERSLSRHPLYQVVLALQNAPKGELAMGGLSVTIEEVTNQTAKFDLLLSLNERGDEIDGTLSYATDLFDRDTVARWSACLQVLLQSMVNSEHCRVGELSILPEGERRSVVESFNATQANYPADMLLHEMFERQAVRTPHAVAVLCGDQYLTYSQLEGRANQLARYLRGRTARPDTFVGLCVERSLEMVVGLIGILKAGAAYVPLDPNYPQQRLELMLQDTVPIVVLSEERLKDRLPAGLDVVMLDSQWHDIARHKETNPGRAPAMSSANLAYTIYTSGSTGRPKGVAIEHRNAVNMVCWAHDALNPEVFDESLFSTSLNFDLSIYECFVPLAVGGTLRVVRDALALAQHPARVTLINTVPSAIRGILDLGQIPSTVRIVNLAGEPLRKDVVDRIFAHSSVECVCNLYGPSETTTYSTWISMGRERGFIGSIGRPIANTKVYILDAFLQPVPIGVAGEIYIGGDGVARGYLNRPDLTAERFLRDPFNSSPRARMYKTGDLGRWCKDGTIEYLGRNDHQVKVRGFRIELGEIEAQLLHVVKEAAVVAREDDGGEKRLIAYVVPHDASAAPNVDQLRSHLKLVLPEHMLPRAVVTLQSLPLTPNGKLDRDALPEPSQDAYVSQSYEAPQTEMEEVLAAIWRELLHVDCVGRHDNFFELGGHSLLIVHLLQRLRRLDLSTEVRSVFQSRTLADLASTLARRVDQAAEVPRNCIALGCETITPQMLPLVDLEPQHIELIARCVPGGAANIQDIYPLVPLQEGILFHHLMSERAGDTYVLPVILQLPSRERLEEFIAALQAVIDRHDILRTAILWEQLPQPLQVVYRKALLRIETFETEGYPLRHMDEWLALDQQRMDLRRAPLMQLRVATNSQTGECYVLWQMHHICDDATSRKILISEIVAHMQSTAQHLLPSVPYRNHVAYALAYSRKHDAESFFRGKLGDIDEPTAPFGLVDVHGDGTQIVEQREEIEPDLVRRARAQAGQLGVSMATLTHAAWAIVVARTSGRSDGVFGTVLLGRLHGNAETQQMLGMFINTLPLRLSLQDATAKELVIQAQKEMIELLNHEQASLAAAQRCSGIVSTAPLFTSLLNYRHSFKDPTANWTGTDIKVLAARTGTNYPITLSVDDLGNALELTAQTDRRIDPHRITSYLQNALQALVTALETAPHTPAMTLPILPSSEWRQVVEMFNATRAEYPRKKRIFQLFEEQVERTPDVIAVVHGKASLTYAEINGWANRLARYLHSKHGGSLRRVAICVERSPEMVVGLLAILKAGAAYVPIDPNYPSERVQYMLQDAAPTVVLTQERLKLRLPPTSAEVIALDAVAPVLTTFDATNLVAAQEGDSDLAYVIYTSGSTGRPKGTIMPHEAMTNLLDWHRRSLPLGTASRVLQFAALSFDVAFQETFSTLCDGGTLVLLDECIRRDAGALAEFLNVYRIERLFVPPLILQSLAEHYATTGVAADTLRDVIAAGEALRISGEIVEYFGRLQGCRLHNHYGPTETHVVTALTLTGDPALWPALPSIGRPIANTQIYVLDELGQPVPMGVPGEIFIGGANIAREYLGRPDLTAARFLHDPYSGNAGARMYRTGDMGRWRSDGTIEYLGRNDDQVKIRGFRIELGEIEAQLAKHPEVKEVAVIALEDQSRMKRLVAYVKYRAVGVNAERLRAYLRELLPDHMIPSAFVVLEKLPTTPSGKLNRRALPPPDDDAYVKQHYDPPQGRAEQIIARVWRQLLHTERVGRQDNFFDLGGHSLLVLKAVSRINEALGSALKVTDMYKCPMLQELAAHACRGDAHDPLVDLLQEANLPEDIVPLEWSHEDPERALLLTGSTGFVGRFLLAQLLQDGDATIYCLVRAPSAQQALSRVRMTLAKWDLWRDEYESRLVAIVGDLRLPRLGMDEAAYQTVCQNIDTIYHCATSMNHLETYQMSKAANVDAALELLRIATSDRPKLINYVSTLGVFGASHSERVRVVTEDTPIDYEQHPNSRGYVASKWVGEKIFLLASERGIPCNIFRLGLIWADTREGRYDELQRGYRILKSCLLSGYGIRNYSHEMIPTPVDYAVRAMVFLAHRYRDGDGVFHIASSRQMSAGVFERCNEVLGTSLELLSWYEWIQAIKRLHDAERSMPVTPLIEFAFSMTEQSFQEYELSLRAATVRFDSTRTHRELDLGGIEAPSFDDELLRLCVLSMLSRDSDLRDGAPDTRHSIEYMKLADQSRWRERAAR